MAKAIKVIERYGEARLPQCSFQTRGAVFRIVIKRTLNIDVAERSMAASKLRICCDRSLKIGLRRVETWRGKSPKISETALVAIPGVQAFRCLAGGKLLLHFR